MLMGLLKGSENVLAYNVFSYTENNPIRYKDECGYCLVNSYGNSINDDKAQKCNSPYDMLHNFDYFWVPKNSSINYQQYNEYPYRHYEPRKHTFEYLLLNAASVVFTGGIATVVIAVSSSGYLIYNDYIKTQPTDFTATIFYSSKYDITKVTVDFFVANSGLDQNYDFFGSFTVFYQGRPKNDKTEYIIDQFVYGN